MKAATIRSRSAREILHFNGGVSDRTWCQLDISKSHIVRLASIRQNTANAAMIMKRMAGAMWVALNGRRPFRMSNGSDFEIVADLKLASEALVKDSLGLLAGVHYLAIYEGDGGGAAIPPEPADVIEIDVSLLKSLHGH